MASHRYWALEFLPRAGSGGAVAVAEVEMRGTPGGADLCTGGTAGGSFSSGQTPAQAFDNNNATVWYLFALDTANYGMLTYDFGSAVNIVEVKVRLGPAGTYNGNTYGPIHARVRYSDDGATWGVGCTGPFDLSALGNDGELVVGSVSDAVPARSVVDGFGALALFAGAWPIVKTLVQGLIAVYRVDYGGIGRIVGTVAILGTPNVPVRRRVRLYREVDGVLVGERWSDPDTGAYEFVGFDPALTYTVLAYDGPRVFRAAVADGVAPELIP